MSRSVRLTALAPTRRGVFRVFGGVGLVAVGLNTACTNTAGTAPTAAPAAKPTAVPAAKPSPATTGQAPQPTAAAKATQAPVKRGTLSLKMGTPTFAFINLPVHLAGSRGLFEEQMIDMELLTLASTSTLVKAILAEELDIAEMDASAQISAIAQGAPARLVGAIRLAQHYMVAAKQEIDSLEELQGKDVAVSQPNSAPNIILELMLEAKGIDPKSMNLISIGGSSNRAQALAAGKVDATLFGVDESETVDADPNLKQLLLVKDVLPKYIGGTVMMHNKVIAQAGATERVMEALVKSTRYCFENKDACVAMMIEEKGMSKGPAEEAWRQFTSIPIWEPNALIPTDRVNYMQDLNIQLGTQQQKLPVDQIVDQRGAEAVLKRLGTYEIKSS